MTHTRRPAAALLRRLGLLLAVTLTLILGSAGNASAHDVLIGSDPADGAELATPPAQVTFTFDQPVQNFNPEVVITGPDGQHRPSNTVTVTGNVVTGTFTDTAKGAYIAAYRIISADGHPVTGEVHFTLTTGTTAAAAPGPTSRPTTGSSAWIWIGLLAAALLIAAAIAIVIRKPASVSGDVTADAGRSG